MTVTTKLLSDSVGAEVLDGARTRVPGAPHSARAS